MEQSIRWLTIVSDIFLDIRLLCGSAQFAMSFGQVEINGRGVRLWEMILPAGI